MQFSDTTNKQGIIQDISFLLGNSVDLNAYKIEDRTRNVNLRFHQVWQMIFESYGGMQFMDDNIDDVPYADVSFNDGDSVILLPSSALTVMGIEITSPSGPRMKIDGITREEFLEQGGYGSYTGTGTPSRYMVYGNKIELLQNPNYSGDARVFFDETISEFDPADTEKVPGFAKPFHRMLSIGGALDYALSHAMPDKVTYLQNLWNDYERRLRDFYSKRFKERWPGRVAPANDLVEEFS